MKSLNNYKLLGYGGASLGIIFFLIAVAARIYSVTQQSTDTLTITYPYQSLAVAYLIIGIIFVATGISGFWLSYLKFERLKPTPTQNLEKTKATVTYEQNFQRAENPTAYNFTYGMGTTTKTQDNKIQMEPVELQNVSKSDEREGRKQLKYCTRCGTQLREPNQKFCSECGMDLQSYGVASPPPPPQPPANELTESQRRQIQLEAIWMHEKTVPKYLRGTWQAKLSFNKLEKGLTESEKQYLKRKRDTE